MRNKLSVITFILNAITGLVWFLNGLSLNSLLWQVIGIIWMAFCFSLAFLASIDFNIKTFLRNETKEENKHE